MTKNELKNKTDILRGKIELASSSMSDRDASTAPELFGGMRYDGGLIKAGTRINHGGTVLKAAADLWDTPENSPENAASLWEKLAYKDGIRIIPDVVTVTSLFAKDELGFWGDVLYRSKLDNNVYTPAQYPSNWEIVS